MKTFLEWSVLLEVDRKLMQYMQSLVPNWPPYVVSDLLHNGHSGDPKALPSFLSEFAASYGYADPADIEWSLENLLISQETFDDDTMRRMSERGMGKFNPYGVPNDAQRHAGAAARLRGDPRIRVRGYSGGASGEPIIVARWRNGKLELVEGWHRTMQAMGARPEGYEQKAYVLRARK